MMKQTLQIFSIIILFGCARYSRLMAQKVTTFTRGSGLINNYVYAIGNDTTGGLWFGTAAGLCRFNGVRHWQDFTGKVPDKVNAIAPDDSLNLWFGTDNGLYQYSQRDDRWTYIGLPPGARAKYITCFYLDRHNNFWIGTKGDGITKRTSTGDWITYNKATTGYDMNNVTAIGSDNNGNTWIGTLNNGIFKFEAKSQLRPVPEFADLIGEKINVIFKDHDDTLWVASSSGVVRLYGDTHPIPCFVQGQSPILDVTAIAEDGEKVIWIGTEAGDLVQYDRLACHLSSVQLENKCPIRSMLPGHGGYLWLATEGEGVSRLHLNWQIFNKDLIGLEWNADITAIAGDTTRNLWLGTRFDGIARYDGDKFKLYIVNPASHEAGMNSVHSLYVDNNNRIWCGTDKGAHCFDGYENWQGYRHDPVKPGLPSDKVNCIIQDHSGAMWFATSHGVAQLKKNNWVIIDTCNGLPAMDVITLWQDNRQHLWFGTFQNGVAEFANDTIISVYNDSTGLLDNRITAITQQQDNTLWIGTEAGIGIFDGINWHDWTTYNSGLPFNNIKCLWRDRDDQTWVGSSDGRLAKFDGTFWWDFSDYLMNDEVNAIFQDSNHHYWFGTDDGLVQYSADELPPQTHIVASFPPGGKIGVASVIFNVTGFDIETLSHTLVYACSLWHDQSINARPWSGFARQNHFELAPLANGKYTFFVKAKDADGNETNPAAQHDFIVDITAPTTTISHPASHAIISGKVTIWGTAYDNSTPPDFYQYHLSYAKVISNKNLSWIAIDSSRSAVINNRLADWDTRNLHGYFWLRLLGRDSLGHTSDFQIQVQVVATSQQASASRGGSISDDQHRIKLYLPPRALDTDAEIYLSPVDVPAQSRFQDQAIQYSSRCYHIGPDTLHLKKPVTLSICYNTLDIMDLDENKLSILYVDSTCLDKNQLTLTNLDAISEGELYGGTVAPDSNIIRTTINKFGTFLLVADNTIKSGDHGIARVNCQPRIFSPGGMGYATSTTISFYLTAESNVSIKIYNLAGRLIRTLLDHQTMRAGYNPVDWDGRDFNNDICPSDLYIVTIESETGVVTKTVMILDRSTGGKI